MNQPNRGVDEFAGAINSNDKLIEIADQAFYSAILQRSIRVNRFQKEQEIERGTK